MTEETFRNVFTCTGHISPKATQQRHLNKNYVPKPVSLKYLMSVGDDSYVKQD